MTKIKVSGLKRPQDAELAVAAGADLVACVFVASSPRYVTLEQAWNIRVRVPATVTLVGIFVDTPVPIVSRMMDSCQLDAVQLFGHEPKADVDALQPRAFKGIVAHSAEDVDEAFTAYLGGRFARFDPEKPAFLLHLTNGVGTRWDLAKNRPSKAPLILAASALGSQTAFEALDAVRPWGVDVWDAVESAPGALDETKLREFIAAVREADGRLAAAAAVAEAESRPRGLLRSGRSERQAD